MTVTFDRSGGPFTGAARPGLLTALTSLVLLMVALALAGCSPTYNWREYRDEDGTYRVLMPGRVSSLSREINLGGLPSTMSMSGALVDDTRFAVGMVRLPATDRQEHALAAMQTAMLRNIGAISHQARDCEITVVDPSGLSVARAAAQCVTAQGRINNKPASMQALFAARGSRAWQVVVIGERVDALQAQTMMDAFRIVETAP